MLKTRNSIAGLGMAEGNVKLHNLIREGLSRNSNVRVRALVARPITRASHEGILWSSETEIQSDSLTVCHLRVINLPLLKHLSFAIAMYIEIVRWRLETSNSYFRFALIDGTHITALPSIFLALIKSNTRIIAFFGDIFPYMACVADYPNRKWYTPVRKIVQGFYRKLDGSIVVAEDMNGFINPGSKPHLVMEGLVDPRMRSMPNSLHSKTSFPSILYAGGLNVTYGLPELVQAFENYGDVDARLIIFGAGDYASNIIEATRRDSRISYRGVASWEEVELEQVRSWLLVNPRPINAQFTRISFPGKNLESMATGTPLLTTRLMAIPKDHLPYVYTIEGSGWQGVLDALEDVLARPRTEIHAFGIRSKEFTMDNKDNITQVERILAFASRLPL